MIIQINFETLIGNLITSENIEEALETMLQSITARDDFAFEALEYYKQVLNALKITKKLDQSTLSQFKNILEQSNSFLYSINGSAIS